MTCEQSAGNQKPSVGRLVHYVSYGTPAEDGKECRAAIVTAVNDDGTLSLCVLNPEGMFFNRSVRHSYVGKDDLPIGGTFHWPARV